MGTCWNFSVIFALILTAWVRHTAMQTYRHAGNMARISLLSHLVLGRNQNTENSCTLELKLCVLARRQPAFLRRKGLTIVYYEFCSILWDYSTSLVSKRWNSADAVQLKTALLFFCPNLTSGFPLESRNTLYLFFKFRSLASWSRSWEALGFFLPFLVLRYFDLVLHLHLIHLIYCYWYIDLLLFTSIRSTF